jgi:hypothetical protein
MHNRPVSNKGHLAQARAILCEDRTTQVTHLALEALRRFKPAGAGVDYLVAAKALAVALTADAAVVPTAALVRNVLSETLGTDRSSGHIAAWLRGFMSPER